MEGMPPLSCKLVVDVDNALILSLQPNVPVPAFFPDRFIMKGNASTMWLSLALDFGMGELF